VYDFEDIVLLIDFKSIMMDELESILKQVIDIDESVSINNLLEFNIKEEFRSNMLFWNCNSPSSTVILPVTFIIELENEIDVDFKAIFGIVYCIAVNSMDEEERDKSAPHVWFWIEQDLLQSHVIVQSDDIHFLSHNEPVNFESQ